MSDVLGMRKVDRQVIRFLTQDFERDGHHLGFEEEFRWWDGYLGSM